MIQGKSLFDSYIEVLNQAIYEHRDKEPFKQILAAGETILRDKNLGVAVYRQSSVAPFDFYTIRLRGGTMVIVDHGRRSPDLAWKVKEDFLRQVAENPRDFVDHPDKLDLDWLKSRASSG